MITIQRSFAAPCKDYLLRHVEGGSRHKNGLDRLLNARLRAVTISPDDLDQITAPTAKGK
ncbi:hypothetical protein [Pseudophaeobacter sp. EL27]|uniref:hypothetical protein n=1 Tax=Pseudophaeobacter sp. EL27 TaxID=2107580 RepID=UPI0013C4D643|nr:hypothetical protein [Pseudophaeobacter sp. EL27]